MRNYSLCLVWVAAIALQLEGVALVLVGFGDLGLIWAATGFALHHFLLSGSSSRSGPG